LVKKIGKNWKLLSEIISTKTGKQIRERFKLIPKIKSKNWTDYEDKLILKYYYEFGSKWQKSAENFLEDLKKRLKIDSILIFRKTMIFDILLSILKKEELQKSI
jgi:hypothetical protein